MPKTIPPTPKALAAASALVAREARKLDTMTYNVIVGTVRPQAAAAQACKVRFLATKLDDILGHHIGTMQVATGVVLAEMRAVARLGVMRRGPASMREAIDAAVSKVLGFPRL